MGLVRRAAELLLGLILLTAPALAGDRALFQAIGYSEDLQYFAFEEFGIHDGSGGAYSHIYVVDLPADKWVYGSPFSVDMTDEDDDTPLATVRSQALAKAQEKLKPLGIDQPVETLAMLGDGIPNADGKAMVWATPSCCGPNDTQGSYSLTLTTFAANAPDVDCNAITSLPSVGYALTFKGDEDPEQELHRDGATLPKSRGCPSDYRLYAVLGPFGGLTPRVAIISYYPFGFEGPDRRFLAVPIDR